MRTFLAVTSLLALGALFLAADAEASPTGLVIQVPVSAEVPYVNYKPGWRGCDPCRTCKPCATYPYYRPYYVPKPYGCRRPYVYPRRGCTPCGRTGYYKKR